MILATVTAGLSENDVGFAQPIVHIDLGGGHVVPGVSENDVIFENRTGLPIARIEIGERVLPADTGTYSNAKILVSVSPKKHHLRVIFRGGADVSWNINFKDVHEITFGRSQNRIEARIQ